MTFHLNEPARKIPLRENVDVLVVGGGPAGIAGAIAAARSGARTRLIEAHGCLGGVWTSGLLSWIIDAKDKPGLVAEILQRLDRADALRQPIPGGRCFAYDPEVMKQVVESLVLQSGADARLYTRVVHAVTDADQRLTHVVTESPGGREAWAARVFIDASGDGALAALAGCGFDLGHPEDNALQPLSLMALIGGVDVESVAPFVSDGGPPAKEHLLAALRERGVTPSYLAPTLFMLRPCIYALMANHEYEVRPDDADGLSTATLRARAEIHRVVGAMRSFGDAWKRLAVLATGEQIGIREGRRVHGLYTVSRDDLLQGARHDDAVCRVHFGIDVHALRKESGRSVEPENQTKTLPYDIPARSLIARDVDGLLLAGRCISGDFFAHSSYRVTGNAVALGEAAGVMAARAAETGVSTWHLPANLSTWSRPDTNADPS